MIHCKCQVCNKNIATIHITEIRNHTKHETHLCAACAHKTGVGSSKSLELLSIEKVAESSGLLTDWLHSISSSDDVTCSNCGMTWKEFRSSARFGCPNDYTIFSSRIQPFLSQMHGIVTSHRGKAAGVNVVQDGFELLRLRNQFREAVQNENYEEAARLRDTIKTLESNTNYSS